MLRTTLCATLLFGCTNVVVDYAAFKPAPRTMTPRPAESVELFTTSKIDHAYVEVGLIEVDSTTLENQIAGMRREAGKRGCDAIFLQSASRSGYAGTCLVYTEPSPQPPTVTPPPPPATPPTP